MSPKCEVASLSSLALYNIVTQVIHALSDDEGLYYNEVSECHKYTPPEILEDMLREILSNENLDAGTRFSCLQVFLRNNIKKLETGIFPHSYYEQIMDTIHTNGTGLVHLNLKGVWMKDNPALLSKVLRKLNRLKELHIPHMPDDDVLNCVASCSTLKVLNISGECNFTEEGLKNFCRTLSENKSGLTVLDIGSFGEENIPHEVIAEMIQALPHLVSLCSYSFVGKSLLSIYKKDPEFRCQLRRIHDTMTTQEECEAIFRLCPSLENLQFNHPEEGVVESLRMFEDGLSCLRLCDFRCEELVKLLERWGRNLRTLKLILGRGVMNLSALAHCGNLTSVELYKMEFVAHVEETELANLEEVEVLYSEMTSGCLKYLLRLAPSLRKIAVGEPVKLTDGDLYRLCADLALLRLEQLWFANARYLTVNAVELLMGHCPQLRVLGQLTGWSISPGDVDFMRAIIQSTNTDLTLLPVGVFGI